MSALEVPGDVAVVVESKHPTTRSLWGEYIKAATIYQMYWFEEFQI